MMNILPAESNIKGEYEEGDDHDEDRNIFTVLFG